MISINSVEVTPKSVNTGDGVIIKVAVSSYLTWEDLEKCTWVQLENYTWADLEGE